jgi:hypothetical protein
VSDEPETSAAGQKLFFDAHPRIFGVVLFALAIIFALWAFYLPIRDALQAAPEVSLYPKMIYLCIIFAIFGVLCLILGPKTYPLALKFDALRGWRKWLFIAVIIIPLIIIGELVKQGFELYLEGFGYKF